LLLGIVLGTIIGLLAFSQRPPVYRASAQVLVVKKQAANALPVAGGDPRMAVMDDYVATHLILIRSPIVIDRAVRKRNLGSLRSLSSNPAGIILAGLSATRDMNKETASAAGNNIINLTYSSSDPADAETVLLAVIESYREFLDETYRDTSDTTVKLITDATDTLQRKLEDKDKAYREFRKTSPVIVVGDNGVPIHQAKILEYQKDAAALLEQVTLLKNRIDEVEKAKKDPAKSRETILALAARKFDKGAPPPLSGATALETALFQLFQQEADLLQFYGEDHPDVIRIRRRIEMTRDFYRKLDEIARQGDQAVKGDPIESALEALKIEYQITKANHDWKEALLEDAVKTARSLETYYDQDRAFREDITRVNKVLDQTLKRLEEINLVRGYGGFEARAIAPPTPGTKISPVFWQFVLMGAVLGLMLGAGAAYLFDRADKSFRSPDEIRRRLGLPLIGHLHFTIGGSTPERVAQSDGRVFEIDGALVVLHRPTSTEAEAFRGVRTAVFFGTHGDNQKVIQVTSPNMGDGKTTLISNLAVSIAQSGRKVLLIDADLRRPRIHRVFGLPGRIGLAELIVGKSEPAAAIQSSVVPGLFILPCGRRPHNPSELLTSPRLADLLDEFRETFDYVLIDSPPLLAVSDPCTLAANVDAVILTIRIAKNGRPGAERASDMLAALKVSCLGIVVNGVGSTGAMSGYGYEHYKYADEYTSPYHSNDIDGQTSDDRAPLSVTGQPSATQRFDRVPTDSTEAALEVNRNAEIIALSPSTNGHPHVIPSE
jgi:capsular exopolysaccharide synthesis family protein